MSYLVDENGESADVQRRNLLPWPWDDNSFPSYCSQEAAQLTADAAEVKARADQALRDGQTSAAVTLYDQLISWDPRNAIVYSNQALALLRAGLAADSLKMANCCVCLRPQWSKAHARRGDALRAIGDLEHALSAYENALRLAGENKDFARRIHDVRSTLHRRGSFEPVGDELPLYLSVVEASTGGAVEVKPVSSSLPTQYGLFAADSFPDDIALFPEAPAVAYCTDQRANDHGMCDGCFRPLPIELLFDTDTPPDFRRHVCGGVEGEDGSVEGCGARYCSPLCRGIAYLVHHRVLCGAEVPLEDMCVARAAAALAIELEMTREGNEPRAGLMALLRHVAPVSLEGTAQALGESVETITQRMISTQNHLRGVVPPSIHELAPLLLALRVNSVITTLDGIQHNGTLTSVKVCGLYEVLSFARHSCAPRIRVSTRGERTGTIALPMSLRPVDKGAELTRALIDPRLPVKERREHFLQLTGVECTCELCVTELQLESLLRGREELL